MSKKRRNNIIKIIIAVICVVLLIAYFYSWYYIKNQERYLKSYLLESNTINLTISSLEEYNQIKSDLPSEFILFITYNQDKKTNALEKKLKKVIDEYKINDIFYYLDATNVNNDEFKNDLKKAFNNQINELPTIIYIKNTNIEKVITSNENILTVDELKNLLENYGFEKAK